MINFLVEMYCGQETSENCSYFVSSGTVNSGECRLKICPCNDNICQLRLDFQTFVLNQPDTCKVIFQFNITPLKSDVVHPRDNFMQPEM